MKKLLTCLSLLALAGCARDGLIDSTGETGVRDIGAGGGEVRGSGVTVVVPEGAVSETVRVTIQPALEGNPDGFLGTPVELGPEGVTFERPIELRFKFDPSSVPELPELVRVAFVQDGDWVPLEDSSVDLEAGIARGTTTHFSRWGLVHTCGNSRTCPAGEACVKHRCVPLEVCDDGVDNDRDGLVDCADADCGKEPACSKVCCFDTMAMACVTSCCQNGFCMGNCYCGSGWCSRCAGGGAEECTNGQDDDGDGFIDCKDPDCATSLSCQQKEICNNGTDDDGDGQVDCADSDCASDPLLCKVCCMDTRTRACVKSCCEGGVCQGNCVCGTEVCSSCGVTTTEDCANSVDDDGDGQVDCADTDCAADPGCKQTVELNCADGIDNDGDGQLDCRDPDCEKSSSCECLSSGSSLCCYQKCAANEIRECLGDNLCGYPCRCVPSAIDAGTPLSWYTTCGDPVCRGWTDKKLPLCTTQKPGDPCSTEGEQCDPQDPCNAVLVCATQDPKQQTGGCPISRERFKKDIEPVEATQLERYHDELMSLDLATYRYREREDGRVHLGFIMDGKEDLACVDPGRDQVDLYGYTSMAVAALKVQASRIAQLEAELNALKAELQRRPARPSRSSR